MADTSVTPIAVIGMACRLPGGIESPDQLWEALLRGEDLVTEVPSDRWDVEEYYDPEPGVAGRSVSKCGAFLDDVGGFDADFFGISEREAIAIDPQHRVLLETAWEAVERAGFDPASLAGSKTGVFAGVTHNDYAYLAADTGSLEGPYGFTGTSFSLASGRISYALGAHGPAVSVDTACSSGLTAVHLACHSLLDGESDLALAGGVSVLLEPRKAASGSAAGMLSPSGRCRAFDVGADGFVSAEGSVVVVLKRLADAQRDGDRVLAVIRGVASNQDGHTVNIATPSRDAQESVYRAALDVAGVDAATIGMVEAHGTGTPVGDPLEYASVAAVYGTAGPCALTSIKTNFGHLQSAAGTLGLMKAVLAVQHGVVPQNLHFTALPDEMAAVQTQLFVPQEATTWPTNGGRPRRAAVSSYGLSGTNVHAIVEQAPEGSADDTAPAPQAPAAPMVFPISASSQEELRRTARQLAEWVTAKRVGTADGPALSDLGYTLSRRRGHRTVRAMLTATDANELVAALNEVADGDTVSEPAVGQGDRGPVWVFSGQGSQWAAMGSELLAKEPVFAATVAQLEPLIEAESGFSVTEAMSAAETVTRIDRIQPTIFAVQVALAMTMKSYGVVPGAVIGHSMGEVAAAVVSGALSLADGVRVICRRSKLMLRLAGGGAMASVELPAAQVLSELAARGISDVSLAVVASPQSTVLGGDAESIRNLVASWDERGVMAREIAVDVASHSAQVDPILDELGEQLEELTPSAPTVPYYSATSYDPRDVVELDSWYWADNLRHTVRFAAAVQAALEDGHRVFAELSPHPLLNHAVDQTARSLDIPLTVLAAMRREQELPFGLRGLLADLHCAGAAVDFSVLYPDGQVTDAPLPTWTHRQLLLDRDGHESGRGAASVVVHPLLGSHVVLPEEPERHVWQGEVGIDAQPWLADHQVHNVAVLPGAAYCEMALAAAHTVLGDAGEVHDITFEEMLLLDEETPVSAAATVISEGVVDFAVQTYRSGELTQRATATLHAGAAGEDAPVRDIDALRDAHPERVEGEDLRSAFQAAGVHHGAAFAGLAAAHTGDGGTVLAEVALPGPLRSQQGGYGAHPAVLDACFQAVVADAGVQAVANGSLLLPLGVRRLRLHNTTRHAAFCLVRVTGTDASGVEADLEVLDENGTVLVEVEGLRLGTGMSESGRADQVLNERLLTIDWLQRDLKEPEHDQPGVWLVIDRGADRDALSANLVAALKTKGADCTVVPWADADKQAIASQIAALRDEALTGVVIVAGPASAEVDWQTCRRGEQSVHDLVHIAQALVDAHGELPRMVVLTRNAQQVTDGDVLNMEQAALRGLMRVIAMEYPHSRVTQVDIDSETDVELVAKQVLSDSAEDETAWRRGKSYVARLCPAPLQADERLGKVIENDREGTRLQVRNPGDLESLELVSFDREAPGPGQIEVAVSTSSINFADVLVAFGQCPSFEGRLPELGTDFAGVVTAVGPGVTRHKVGDRVGGVSGNGCWGTFVTCDADLAVTLPEGMSEAQAAAVATAAATAWYSLHDLARITAGDKVLIHSGTGGVGQAAIAIAKAAGAEIYATAGSDQRRQLLRDWGIEHVYDSRSVSFAEEIRRDTDGYGVDIVLNSVVGPLQRAGIELLAFNGRFVEIGKRDIYGDTRVGLFPFRRNLTFYAVDLALMSVTHPGIMRSLLEKVFQLTADGYLPMPRSTHYPLADAATAIRAMGGAQHTGKLLLDVPRTGQSTVVVAPQDVPVFREDGSYILTGGLGGLGLFLAEKMAAAGCGRIVLSSRSRPSAQALEIIELIRAAGGDIVVESGDIAEDGTAERLVEAATATGLPLRGVVHAAAVVEDATLTNITDDIIQRDWAPKVYGAWNLHEATASLPLDWFCVFSSAAPLVGSPGQGAYAAANSWLDAFTFWRRSQGLPATTIAWGAWAEIGRGVAMAAGDNSIAPDEGAYAFESLLRYERAYTGYAPIMGAPWLVAFAERTPFAEMFKSAAQSGPQGSKLRAELNTLPAEEWPTHLRRIISEQVSLLLRRAVDPDRPLPEYGLDSLGNLELRTRIEAETGVRINSMDITTIRGLADHLCERLAGQEPATAAS
ncbi:type I polyketide synthase [Mycolicibacterium wolinskyi]|uniref:Polyketide synthase n=1 Tax=Mycolicibacterium wolinskyi TaxID=59750 RepID=A0A1X2F607_9MYCO|nr:MULTISPECIES: type I polyketide synthase [Mycolicibacterium]MCV7284177.1 type I polyketide synthase [Mycolicibacterium wolinskyi]MCV7294013.1 type I polyketide synthase [Mycolicibacterium goodii]ORX13837.1 polyketide synthase [Mycolicibacterium wolinskyi]